MDRLNELLNDSYGRHTRYQVQNFIIGLNGKTDYGMYRQCIREIMSRIDSIISTNKEYEEAKHAFSSYKEQAKFMQLQEIMYEFNIFYNYAIQLKDRLGQLSSDQIEKLEAEFWQETFKEKICLELLGTGHVSPGLLETVMYSENKIDILTFLANLDKKKALDYLTKHEVNLTLDTKIEKLTINDIFNFQDTLSVGERRLLNE